MPLIAASSTFFFWAEADEGCSQVRNVLIKSAEEGISAFCTGQRGVKVYRTDGNVLMKVA